MSVNAVSRQSDARSAGYLSAASAYILWGLLPLYWKPLEHLPAMGILAYRVGFSFLFSWAALVVLRRLPVGKRRLSGRQLLWSLGAAALIGLNWFVYIWSVLNGYTIEASLGYFLTPMVNLLFGMVLLKERPGPVRGAALIISAVAVVILTINYGRPPLIALTLAFTFGSYGYLKKLSGLDALTGLAMETAWLFPAALAVLLGGGALKYLTGGPVSDSVMLILAGPVTLAPLLLFAAAARRIPLYALGFFQYIAPSMMFVIGWRFFGEEVSTVRLVAFSLVWLAIVVFSISMLPRRRGAIQAGGGAADIVVGETPEKITEEPVEGLER